MSNAVSKSLSTLATRIQSKIRISENGCVEWTGKRLRGGYGMVGSGGFGSKRRTLYVHRVVYQMWRGPVPPGLELDHLCRNKACCNPLHLEPVTRSVNVRRGLAPQTN